MNTTEKNKLIAEFMGAKPSKVDYTEYHKDGSIKFTTNEDGSKWIVTEYSEPEGIPDDTSWGRWIHGDRLKYHTSWNWLMPVLKKINLKLTPQNYDEWRMISKPTEYVIESVHNQAVEFIQWYNENK